MDTAASTAAPTTALDTGSAGVQAMSATDSNVGSKAEVADAMQVTPAPAMDTTVTDPKSAPR